MYIHACLVQIDNKIKIVENGLVPRLQLVVIQLFKSTGTGTEVTKPGSHVPGRMATLLCTGVAQNRFSTICVSLQVIKKNKPRSSRNL